MAYFHDLSPYAYGHHQHPGVVHVGWLDGSHPYPKGSVAPDLIARMKRLATKPVELYRGIHLCEICVEPTGIAKTFVPNKGNLIDPSCAWMKWADERMGNGEIRAIYEGVTFAAPILIVHYIEEHAYLPPTHFLRAIEKTDLR
jgi:hypothetical protein